MPRRNQSPSERRTPLALSATLALAIAALPLQPAGAAGLTTLYSFPCGETNCTDGASPEGGLIADAHGNLFGTTFGGGTQNAGTVFETSKMRHGYVTAPLVSFDGSHGSQPYAGLVADRDGNLLGTTSGGGVDNNNGGTVFELEKTPGGYASTPIVLYSFCVQTNCTDGANPLSGLLADPHGNLFGTTFYGGEQNKGTVFELEKTAQGYASAPTILYSFCIETNCADGAGPRSRLILDRNGDLFGTTTQGGTNGKGTVFEIVKTSGGYSSTPTILYSFCPQTNCPDGSDPVGGLLADPHGNLFGTTSAGGTDNDGTVFEIEKTSSGYAAAPLTLVSFDGTDGAAPKAALIADPHGDLFGTTLGDGGVHNQGTVFEIKKTAHGYASAPTSLVVFDGKNGSSPIGGLLADARGNLFGTTVAGGATENGQGTVFEIPAR
jgi:uncharacterized repeat protein (TIGR03803 family)